MNRVEYLRRRRDLWRQVRDHGERFADSVQPEQPDNADCNDSNTVIPEPAPQVRRWWADVDDSEDIRTPEKPVQLHDSLGPV